MTRVVLDTNVLVSGTFWSGKPFQLLKLVDEDELDCFTSKEIIEEYDRVVHSTEILPSTEEYDKARKWVMQKIVQNTTVVEPSNNFDKVEEDPDDNKFLECAVEANADYIISGDQHLLDIEEFKGIEIITVKEFLKQRS